jgi:glycosyltransferase involved in cell wall biosynthesis
MDLSIIVPFVNEWPQSIFTLQAIAQELVNRLDFEVMAVDNFCQQVEDMAKKDPLYARDKGGEVIKGSQRASGGWLKYVEYKDKLSHWNAKNCGVGKSTGDVLMFIDAHCIPARDSIFSMFKYYVREYDRLHGSIHLPLTYKILDTKRLIYKMVYVEERADLHYSFTGYRAETEPYNVPCMSTCGMMVSREIFDDLGGWPSELGIYGGGENFFNYTQAVLGYSKWIMVGPPLHHYGEKRKYHWFFDDMVRNRMIATYMFGGAAFAKKYSEHSKGNPSVLQKIYNDVISKCKAQRGMIRSKQVTTIQEWINQWK